MHKKWGARQQDKYRELKADPVKYEQYLARKRSEVARKAKANPTYAIERKKRWQDANRERALLLKRANGMVNRAVAAGRLERPDCCDSCTKVGKVEAHHASYAREDWLKVIWLCRRCHMAEHAR